MMLVPDLKYYLLNLLGCLCFLFLSNQTIIGKSFAFIILSAALVATQLAEKTLLQVTL